LKNLNLKLGKNFKGSSTNKTPKKILIENAFISHLYLEWRNENKKKTAGITFEDYKSVAIYS
jgi:hypothetical protein